MGFQRSENQGWCVLLGRGRSGKGLKDLSWVFNEAAYEQMLENHKQRVGEVVTPVQKLQ